LRHLLPRSDVDGKRMPGPSIQTSGPRVIAGMPFPPLPNSGVEYGGWGAIERPLFVRLAVASLAESVVGALEAEIDPKRIVTDPFLLGTYRGIAWGVATSKVPLDRPLAPPVAVVRPRGVADVQAALNVARTHGTPVIP